MAEYADVAAELGVAEELDVDAASQEAEDGPVNQDVIALHRAWVNESVCPEMLPYNSVVVEDMTELIQNQEEHLEALRTQDADQAWSASLYTQDLDRIKFGLARYLRVRLAKIESYAWKYSAQDEEFVSKLSDTEQAYAKRYVDLLSHHYSETVLSHLPTEFSAFPGNSASDGANPAFSPDLNTYVFCRVKDEGGVEVQLDGDEHTFLENESIHVVRYPPVKELVGNQLELI